MAMVSAVIVVVFGGATALLPLYAKTILHAGPRGYGLLTSSFEIGALAMSTLLMLHPPSRNAGRILLTAVAVYGVATIVFGLSRVFGVKLPLNFDSSAGSPASWPWPGTGS